MNIFNGFADSLEEVHYLIGGVAIGIVIGITITVAMVKILKGKNG